MATPIKTPDLGTNVDEVRLVFWLVDEGQPVRRGQPIAEVETDKASAELESAAEGVLLKQMVAEDTEVGKGTIIAYVGEAGESIPEPEPKARKRPRTAPVVKNLARKLGVDLDAVEGTGRGGMITREDVTRVAEACGEPEEEAAGLSRRQRAVARAVIESAREIPHLRMQASVDMTAVERLRSKGETSGVKPSYDAVLLKAMATSLPAAPALAAHMENERPVRPEGTHISVAVGAEEELFLPVIRDVDTKDLATLTEEIADVAERARDGRLKTEEMTGGGMALSNLGMYPIEAFDALIFPGQGAILSVGAVERRAVPVGDTIEVRPMATLRLAADHRLVNGRQCAEYLARLKKRLEEGNLE